MLSVTSLVLCLCGFAISAKFPPTFPKCFRPSGDADAAEFNACFVKASDEAKSFMRKGIPNLGIPGLEKFVIPSITVEQKGRALEFVCTLSNVSVEGLDGYQVSDVRMVFKDQFLKLSIHLAHVDMKGEYDIEGRILGEGVKQKGPFKAQINDTKIDVTLMGEIHIKKGLQYGNFTNLDIEPKIGKVVGNFENLFGNNKVLNKASEAFLEESTDLLIDALKPDFFALAKKIILQISSSISVKIPLDELFPPRPV